MNRLIAGLVVLVGALAAFYVGAKYGEAHASTSSMASTNANGGSQGAAGSSTSTGAGGGAGTRTGAGSAFGTPAASGQIVSVANGVITVHDRQTGKDVKVNVGSARITKTTQGTAADLTVDSAVTVAGQTGSDGTVNAQAIAIGGGSGGGGRVRPSPSS